MHRILLLIQIVLSVVICTPTLPPTAYVSVVKDPPCRTAAAFYATYVVLKSGGARAWGYNGEGTTGYGNSGLSYPNDDVPLSPLGVRLASLGSNGGYATHVCAITTTNDALCFGANDDTQLGYPNTEHIASVGINNTHLSLNLGVLQFADTFSVRHIALGNGMTTVTSHRKVYNFGNYYGMLGGDVYRTSLNASTHDFGAGVSIEHATCGGTMCGFLLSNGSVFAFGWNYHGNLGMGNLFKVTEMTELQLESAVVLDFCFGSYFSCFLVQGGGPLGNEVKCMGENRYCELGTSDNTSIEVRYFAVAQAVPLNSTGASYEPIKISCGGHHALVIMSDGSVITWGDVGKNCVLVRLTFSSRAVQIAGGAQDSMVVLENGDVYEMSDAPYASVYLQSIHGITSDCAAAPTVSPTPSPTAPTSSPTPSPTAPTISPTLSPTRAPSNSPTLSPTMSPTPPTFSPTASPTTPSPSSIVDDGMASPLTVGLAVGGSTMFIVTVILMFAFVVRNRRRNSSKRNRSTFACVSPISSPRRTSTMPSNNTNNSSNYNNNNNNVDDSRRSSKRSSRRQSVKYAANNRQQIFPNFSVNDASSIAASPPAHTTSFSTASEPFTLTNSSPAQVHIYDRVEVVNDMQKY